MEVANLGRSPSLFDCLPFLSCNSHDSEHAWFQMCLCTLSLCDININLLKLHFWWS